MAKPLGLGLARCAVPGLDHAFGILATLAGRAKNRFTAGYGATSAITTVDPGAA